MKKNHHIVDTVLGTENPVTFTGKEWCKSQWLAQRGPERGISETGYSYFGARYYDSDLSGLFLSVDPMSDKYPNISPYSYCAWNPVKLVDPDGELPILPILLTIKGTARGVDYYSKKSKVKTIAYTVNHPCNAIRVGIMKDGGRNGISSFAHIFSVGMCKAANLSRGPEGSQRNAIRHTL